MIGRKKKPEPIRRNPHLGSQKQSTFQYSSNRTQSERSLNRVKPEESDKVLVERLNNAKIAVDWRHKLAVAGIVAVAVILSSLTASPKLHINGGGSLLRTQVEYEQAVTDIVGKGISSYSKVLVNRQQITEELETKYPELTQVNVSTPLFSRRLNVYVAAAQPVAVLDTGTSQFLLDNRGVALLDAKKTPSSVSPDSLIRINDDSGAPIAIGKPAVTSDQMTFITEVKRQSEAKELTIDSTTLTAGGGELHVRYSGVGYFVKYNLYDDARKSFGTYYATKEYLQKTRVTPAEYIDVRVPERAYIK
jgi:hypothetical protein